MSIDIDTLEKATNIMFRHLRDNGIKSVGLEEDFYWVINKDQRYDPYMEPTEINLSQLTDNLEELERIASGDKDPTVYALVWLAAIYRYIGEKNPD